MSNSVDMAEPIPMDESSNKIQQQKEDDDHHRQCVDELRTIFLQVHHYQQEPDKHVSRLQNLSLTNSFDIEKSVYFFE